MDLRQGSLRFVARPGRASRPHQRRPAARNRRDHGFRRRRESDCKGRRESIGRSAPAPVAAVAPSVPPAATGPGASAAAPPPATAAPAAAPPAAASAPPSAARAAGAAPAGTLVTLPAEVQTALDTAMKNSKVEGAFWSGQFRSMTSEPSTPSSSTSRRRRLPRLSSSAVSSGTRRISRSPPTGRTRRSRTSRAARGRTRSTIVRSPCRPAAIAGRSASSRPAGSPRPVATASSTFRLESKPGEFGVSPLILANTLTPLTKQPGPTDPFVFGVEKPIKVEPKGDRQFAKEDSLWYFYAINDPVVTAAACWPPRLRPRLPAPRPLPPPLSRSRAS